MTTPRETATLALEAAIRAAMPAGVTVLRGEPLAVLLEDAPAAIVNLAEGPAVETGATVGVVIRDWRVDVWVELLVQDDTAAARWAALDTLLAAIGTALADRTLGGTVAAAVAGQPDGSAPMAVEGAADMLGAVVPVSLYFSTGRDPFSAA